MASIETVVNVTITNTTPTITQAGFGVPMILDFHTKNLDRFRIYESLADMVTDGFAVTDAAYLAAQAVFSQNPSPTSVMVARRLTAPIQKYTLQVTNVEVGYEYAFTFAGGDVSYTVQVADTPTIVAAAIEALIAGLAGAFGSSVVTDTITITNSVAGAIDDFTYPLDGSVKVQNTTADVGVATDLNEILALTNDWYGLILTSRGKAEIAAAAAWIEASKKIFAVATADADVKDSGSTTDVAYVNKVNRKTGVIWHHLPLSFPDAAWMGRMFPEEPGSATWALKTLAGVQPSPSAILSATEQAAILAKNSNFYVTAGGVNHTRFGTTGTGEFFDIVRGLDWLEARIEEDVFALKTSVKKVPYTLVGIAMIEAAIRARMLDGANKGLLVEDTIEVSFPALSAIITSDKADRLLPGGRFSAQLQGAVHKTLINGEVFV